MVCLALLIVTLLLTISTTLGYDVASDDSGKYLVAVGSPSHDLITSTDYGNTWTTNSNLHTTKWASITSDSTGKRLNMAFGTPGPYFSRDQGVTWNKKIFWNASQVPLTSIGGGLIDSDATGTIIYAVGTAGVHISADGGKQWVSDPIQEKYNLALAVSGDASVIYMSCNNYISYRTQQNGEVTWVPTHSVHAEWVSLSTDFTGNIIAGAFLGSEIHLSVDRGATYRVLPVVISVGPIVPVKVSSDGTMLYYLCSTVVHAYNIANQTTIVGVLDKPTSDLNGLSSVDCSEGGKYVVIGSYDHVWVSADYGETFTQTI